MDSDWKATAGVEAVDYKSDEEIDVLNDLGESALRTKLGLTNASGVPMYVVTSRNKSRLGDLSFDIRSVTASEEVTTELVDSSVSPQEFVRFWAGLKGTKSTKPLPDADVRIQDSNVDNVLREGGLEWGGNVDGILANEQSVKAIIECRKTNKSSLSSYDPNNYFHYRGGDYNTWRPLYNISEVLNVPLILLTFKNGVNGCGCAYVDNMSRGEGLTYKSGITPDNNILTREEAITELNGLL
jgi:hypothetical protein